MTTRHTTNPDTGAQGAVAQWLRAAAAGRSGEGNVWRERGFLLLPCGVLFSAVRLSAELVQAAAASTDTAVIDLYLAGALDDGPVICDRHAGWYYALVPASTAHRWAVPGTVCLGGNSSLGVPHPSVNGTAGERLYWSVPMASPGLLCPPHAVAQLVEAARTQAVSHA
ncbi:hypothetical protein AB0469_25895 [Streptomyces sp. NPDC093801]|uniref:hypothetical protein n=1 Tax=Streptomyces sp. NPDC093801 TaxID=3155203 RepID=UPI00344D042E